MLGLVTKSVALFGIRIQKLRPDIDLLLFPLQINLVLPLRPETDSSPFSPGFLAFPPIDTTVRAVRSIAGSRQASSIRLFPVGASSHTPGARHRAARLVMATPATAARKSHRGKLSALQASGCQGKTARASSSSSTKPCGRRSRTKASYDPSVHSWRFTEPAPLPRGKLKYPNSVVLDEQAKEEKARLGREEKQLLDEKLQQRQRVEEELQRRKKQFAPGKAPSDKLLRKEVLREDRLAMAEERHVNNVLMALCVMNRSHPDSRYELTNITERCTFFEVGSAYSHYNYTVHSPIHGDVFFFAETFPNAEREYDVYQCCTIGSGPYGSCMGCLKQRVGVTHPGSDMFIGGHEYESVVEFLADSESDEDY